MNREQSIHTREDAMTTFLKHQDKTVVGEKNNQAIIMLAGISSVVKNIKSTNVKVSGNVSAGKSYMANSVIDLIPGSNASSLANMTPKALQYSEGFLETTMVDDLGAKQTVQIFNGANGEYQFIKECECEIYKKRTCGHEEIPTTVDDEMKRSMKYVVDLTGKVFLFTDKANVETLMALKPIMSSDNEEIEIQTAQNSGKETKTKKIVLRGHPAFIMCDAKGYSEDISEIESRCVQVSVEESAKKLKRVQKMTTDNLIFDVGSTKEDDDLIKEQLAHVFETATKDIRVRVPLARQLQKHLPATQPTDNRTYKDYVNLLKLHAVFNASTRPVVEITKDGKVSYLVFTTKNDYKFLSQTLETHAGQQRTGLNNSAHLLWKNILIQPKHEVLSSDSIVNQQKLDGKVKKQVATDESSTYDWWTMREITEAFNKHISKDSMKSNRAIQAHEMKQLKNQGFVEVRNGNPNDGFDDKQTKYYRAIADSKDLVQVDDNFDDVTEKIRSEFFEELEKREPIGIGITPIGYTVKYLDGIDGTVINKDEFQAMLLNGDTHD